jgi:hypothetical protein
VRGKHVILARVLTLVVAAVATVASAATELLPVSGEVFCERRGPTGCGYLDVETGLSIAWPSDWPVRRLKLLTESGPPANARHRDAVRWVSLEYVPDDPAQPEVSLLSVAVLKRADWIRQSTLAGARFMDEIEVATGKDYVVVAMLARAHPYPPDSRDADIFEALTPRIEEVSRVVRLPTQDSR